MVLFQVHFLYQFSLQFFLEIFSAILTENANLKDKKDYSQRLAVITKDLFQVSYNRVSRGMLHQDRILFAVLLTRIHLKLANNKCAPRHVLRMLFFNCDVMLLLLNVTANQRTRWSSITCCVVWKES